MAYSRFTLPSLTTSIPPTSSSSSSSSPLTPLSELNLLSNTLSGILTPNTSLDVRKSTSGYITYPEPSFPPRQLTPPPKSRFVPLFESISKSTETEYDFSRRGSLGDDEASPAHGAHSLPFSPVISKQTRKNLSLTVVSSSVEPALKSAPLTSSFSGSLWGCHSGKSASLNESLHETIRTLQHQLNATTQRLRSADAEVARLTGAYQQSLEDKEKLLFNYSRAQKRVEELEVLLKGELPHYRHPTSLDMRGPINWTPYQSTSLTAKENKGLTWQEELTRKVSPEQRRNEGHCEPSEDTTAETAATVEPVTEEAYKTVLTKIPEMPSEVIISTLAPAFLASGFNWNNWLESNGLELPRSARLLSNMNWDERLSLDSAKLGEVGVTNENDKSYIMRILKAIAEGEEPHLHSSLRGAGFTPDHYVAIMREQRIDKHVPNLSGIPWPLRLFVDEEDLMTLQVQKAGARGTIITVFGGLRKGGPRPDPRPRRGTKKSKRTRSDHVLATLEINTAGDKSSGNRFIGDKSRAQPIKFGMGRPTAHMAGSLDKNTPTHRSAASNSSSSSWFGPRM